MGSTLPKKTVEFKQLKTKSGVHVASASMQGWRDYMQDSSCIKQISDDVLFAAVFDGHGGPEVAQFLTAQLVKELAEDPFYKSKNYNRALVESFRKVDERIGSEQGQKRLKNIQKQYSSAGSKKKAVIGQQVGSTANVLLLTENKIYLANIGDSRAILCRNGKGIPLSFDHKPTNPIQKERIIKAGGQLKHNRINDGINISRSFGDFFYKSNNSKQPSEQMVISIPQIKEQNRSHQDQYIVLASDGVWQRYLTNYQWFISELNQFLAKSSSWSTGLQSFLESLLAKKQNQLGSGHDNMSIILILLKSSLK